MHIRLIFHNISNISSSILGKMFTHSYINKNEIMCHFVIFNIQSVTFLFCQHTLKDLFLLGGQHLTYIHHKLFSFKTMIFSGGT